MNIVKFAQPIDRGRPSKLKLTWNDTEIVEYVLFTSMFISQKSHVLLLVGLL